MLFRDGNGRRLCFLFPSWNLLRNPKAACSAGDRSCCAQVLPAPPGTASAGIQPTRLQLLTRTPTRGTWLLLQTPLDVLLGAHKHRHTLQPLHSRAHVEILHAHAHAHPAHAGTPAKTSPRPLHAHVHLLAHVGMHPAHRCTPCLHVHTHASCMHMHARTCTCAWTPSKPPACMPMRPARARLIPPPAHACVALTHSWQRHTPVHAHVASAVWGRDSSAVPLCRGEAPPVHRAAPLQLN